MDLLKELQDWILEQIEANHKLIDDLPINDAFQKIGENEGLRKVYAKITEIKYK